MKLCFLHTVKHIKTFFLVGICALYIFVELIITLTGLVNHSQSFLPVLSCMQSLTSHQPSTHTSIFCQSLGLSFVWSLGDMQQSPLLFCFSQFALCRLEMGNRSKAEWMSCFARSPSLNGFQGWVSLCMCVWVWVCMTERGRVAARESLRECACVLCM